jgi:hypothetical protein
MLRMLRLLAVSASRFYRSLRDLLFEDLALRQQLAVSRRGHPEARFPGSDRLFWKMLRRVWSEWKQIFVQPETLVRWHRSTVAETLGSINADDLKMAHARIEISRTLGKLVLEKF